MEFQLTTERLSISLLSPKDLEPFVAYRQDPVIARYQSWDTTYSSAQGLELIQSQATVPFLSKGEWFQLAIHSLSTGELLGDIALHVLEEADNFEIGYTLAAKNHGQGFAREAVAELLRYLFEDLTAQRVLANTDSRNQASINLLLRLGFTMVPSKSWTEEFKGETVTVNFFELHRNQRA